jgi:lipoprotein-anchoring transpeptidase ErfK/SrfK
MSKAWPPIGRSLAVAILFVALLCVACSSGRATAPTSASTDSRASTSITTPLVTTTALATATTAPATTTSLRVTTTTVPLVTLPGGLVIQPYYEVVQAKGAVHALAAPAGATLRTFDRLNELRAVTTLLAVSPPPSWGAQGWYEVLLPMRPNGRKGWVSSDQVSASLVTTAVVIRLAAHKLTLYDRGRESATYPVGVGSATNPTPTGSFFVTGVLKGNPSSAYGSYALGTSAFSDTLTDWPGGGVVGIHGTNDPSSVGRNVSHGCIRLRNADITQLASAISLGTPIFILP